MRDPAWERLHEAFARREKPRQVQGCDCPFCVDEAGIRALMDADPERLGVDELGAYARNFLGTIGGPHDAAFLMPAMLRAWRAELAGESGYVEALHGSLIRAYWRSTTRGAACDAFELLLTPGERTAALDFMREALLDRLGSETSLDIRGNGPTHVVHAHVYQHAAIAADHAALFERWWAFEQPGHAIAAVQYASALAFTPASNPVFAPWTKTEGGGAPDPVDADETMRWWFGSGERWLPANLPVLERLAPERLLARLHAARKRLESDAHRRKADAITAAIEADLAGVRRRIEGIGALARQGAPMGAFWSVPPQAVE
jgi:hypothetical protein